MSTVSLSPLEVCKLSSPSRCTITTARVIAIKKTLVRRYEHNGTAANLIREAIALAEAEAWRTGFPHLFLPELADETLRQLAQKRSLIHPELAHAA
jgi:hypothetical protein